MDLISGKNAAITKKSFHPLSMILLGLHSTLDPTQEQATKPQPQQQCHYFQTHQIAIDIFSEYYQSNMTSTAPIITTSTTSTNLPISTTNSLPEHSPHIEMPPHQRYCRPPRIAISPCCPYCWRICKSWGGLSWHRRHCRVNPFRLHFQQRGMTTSRPYYRGPPTFLGRSDRKVSICRCCVINLL